VTSLHAINNAKTVASEVTSWDFLKAFEGWDTIFDKLLRGLEDKAAQVIFWALKCLNPILNIFIRTANHV
jgi:hypothetical protein